jgi:hypothetical protein
VATMRRPADTKAGGVLVELMIGTAIVTSAT